jgi:hypothetical protein
MGKWARSDAAAEMPRGEQRVAVLSAAALYVVGAALIATTPLLPEVESPAGAAAVAVTAVVTAAGLILGAMRGHAGLGVAWLAELWGVVVIAFLCASTGGPSSPFALLYFFAIGHAAAFQPRERFLVVSVAGLLAFLAPLLYAEVSTNFAAVGLVGAVLALLTTIVIHLALQRMRDQRRRLEFLIAATGRLDTSLDPQQTLRRIANTAVPELAQLCVIDLVDASRSITTTVAAAVVPALAEQVEEMHRSDPPVAHPANPLAEALGTRRTCVVEEPEGTPAQPEADDDHRRLMRDADYRSAAVVPMVARGRVLGAISFFRREAFEPGQLALIEDLTGRASQAYDNARLYAERAQVAHTLRRSLMPAALPVVPGLELESFFQPVGAGSEVGGDFYDVFGDRGNCWLVVGDVCGKGAEAAVLTGFLRHTTIAYAREGEGPANVLARVNRAMLEQDFDGRFATAILAHLGFRSSGVQLTIATAGHPAALVARAGGAAEEIGEAGTLLGVFSDPSISEASTLLRPGDALALYTDGFAEAQAPARVLSVEQMIDRLATASPDSARAAIDALLALIDLENGARDDIAILAAHVSAAAGRRIEGAALSAR